MLEELDQSPNGTVTDEEFERLQAEYEETPLLIRTLTSKKIDDLKGMSEVPRRLIFQLTNMDVVIAAREHLQEKLFQQALRSYKEAIQMLEDDDPENDPYALRKLNRAKAKMQMAIVQRGESTQLMKTFLRSFLLYMQGVDRKGRGEVLEAFASIAQSEDGEEVTAR